ncbi:MAG: glucose-6-phosphate isomerase [Pseudomonadota bacterium]|jgi:glucose-6-phosphate isomerase
MNSWNRYKELYFFDRAAGFGLDVSRMNFELSFLESFEGRVQEAFRAMTALEGGAIANPDENRMVGHYWLRTTELAPTAELRREIETTIESIRKFAGDVHAGRIAPAGGGKFKHLLVVGIGGSALGPQFVSQALRSPNDPLDLYFFDNTDPDGMARVIRSIPSLHHTVCVVISKSGGTKESRNGQLVAKAAFRAAGIPFERHFVAVTGVGSELDKTAVTEKWLARFPMWDWVGGRTSELSAVGLLPAALQGFDIEGLLRGAREMDILTRRHETRANPAALLALMWYHAGCGRGSKDMVVLPYKDRLELFSRYLQQLVMESLGKEKDLAGKTVNQGIAVYGNKGSTDQHAYVQQLRDGLNNFFVVFLEALKDTSGEEHGAPAGTLEVEPGITSGDYLSGFLLGTRSALFEQNRESITITVDEVSPRSIGMLIALFERAVGLYASLVGINAYHQPGVEAGKKAAARVLDVQRAIFEHLGTAQNALTADEITAALGAAADGETVFKTLRHLAINGRIRATTTGDIFKDTYSRLA